MTKELTTASAEIEVIKLKPKQEMFATLFASDREFFGNGVQSYIEAYDPDMTKKGAYATARASASRLLTNVNVLARIDQLFEARGLNDQFVDKQLEKIITQDADFTNKMSAIKEYNTLKARTAKKSDETGNTYNTFIQQNNLDPSLAESKDIVDTTLEMLMEKMKQTNG